MRKNILQRLDHVRRVSADQTLRAQIRAIPKYEVHVHLGGAMRRSTIVDLAQQHGIALPASKGHFLRAETPLPFFPGATLWELFHNTYQWYWSCVTSCDDLKRIVVEFLEDSAAQGVVYSEFTLSGTYLMRRFPFDEWTDAVGQGISEAGRRHPIQAGAILDISRRLGMDNAIQNVERIIERRPACLVGIGMGGDEVRYPHHLFIEAFRLARAHHIPSTVHVAEFGDGATTIDVIKDLRPSRLGHALNTIKSPVAYDLLHRSGLHVESCPLCNFVGAVGGVDAIAAHPIRQYFRDGIPLSINTDDPQIFGYDLIDTYCCLMQEAGFTLEDLTAINRRTRQYLFAPPRIGYGVNSLHLTVSS